MSNLHRTLSDDQIHVAKGFSTGVAGSDLWKNENSAQEFIAKVAFPPALDFKDGNAAPPLSPNAGDIYVIIDLGNGSVDSGWSTGPGADYNDWVRWSGFFWVPITPQEGAICYNKQDDEYYKFDGSDWVVLVTGGGSINKTNIVNVDALLGVNAVGEDVYQTVEYALTQINNTATTTANTTSSSNILTGVIDTSSVLVGDIITGTGIQYNSIVLSKTINTITLSKDCTATATGITITKTTLVTVIVSGNVTATGNWAKSGVNIDTATNKCIINWGNFCLFNYSTNQIIPVTHKIYKANGTGISSIFLGNTGGSLSFVELYVYFESIFSKTTDYLFSATLGITITQKCEIKGGFLDARFGRVCSIGGSASKILDFNSYGLLGGIAVDGLGTQIFGRHETPTSISVLSGGNYCKFIGDLIGSTTFGLYSSIKGYLNGNTHTFQLCDVELATRSTGTFTFTGGYKNSLKCHADDNPINVTIDSGILSIYGESNINLLTVNGVCNFFASNLSTATLSGAGTIYNYGLLLSIFGCTYVYNYGTMKIRDIIYTSYIENYGKLLTGYRGLLLDGAKTFINKGIFESNELLFDIDAMVRMTSVSAVFENWGVIKAYDTSITKPVIQKSAGTLKLYAGSYIKVANGKSPIKCTANTSDSKDIIVESCVTNCDGTTYGLSFAFDGGSFAPNDIMNTFTTTRENTLF